MIYFLKLCIVSEHVMLLNTQTTNKQDWKLKEQNINACTESVWNVLSQNEKKMFFSLIYPEICLWNILWLWVFLACQSAGESRPHCVRSSFQTSPHSLGAQQQWWTLEARERPGPPCSRDNKHAVNISDSQSSNPTLKMLIESKASYTVHTLQFGWLLRP